MRTNFFAAILISVLMCSCGDGNKLKPKLPADSDETIPTYVMRGFDMVSTENGEIKISIKAEGAQVFEKKKKAYAQKVIITQDEGKGKRSVLTGERAIIDTDTNFIEIYGDVRLNASNGSLLLTERLFWDEKKQKVFTEEAVTIIKGKSVLKGIGMESDSGLNEIEIKKRVEFRAKDIDSE